jgi:phage-related protein
LAAELFPKTESIKTRPISWVKAALKDFNKFPEGSKTFFMTALTVAAEGGKADSAKPLSGLGSGVLEKGKRTDKQDIDIIKSRIKGLKEMQP